MEVCGRRVRWQRVTRVISVRTDPAPCGRSSASAPGRRRLDVWSFVGIWAIKKLGAIRPCWGCYLVAR